MPTNKTAGPEGPTAERLAKAAEPNFIKTDPDFDFNDCVESQVNWSLWRALRAGHLRLAVPCRACGRALTATGSRRAHIGPHCAAKQAIAEAVIA